MIGAAQTAGGLAAFWQTNKKIIIVVIVILAILIFIYFAGKRAGRKPRPLDLPDNGQGIPQNWSAYADAANLRAAMGSNSWFDPTGWGTDENAIISTLTGKSDDQLAAIYNEYGRQYDEDLLYRLEGELSGSTLSLVTSMFNRALGRQ